MTIRWIDSVESRLESGVGSRALAETLASAGISRILLRRDVDAAAADVAEPERVARALTNSPGLYPVASFGMTGFGDQPLIEVLRVAPAQFGVSAQTVATTPTLYGGPDDVLAAREVVCCRLGNMFGSVPTRSRPASSPMGTAVRSGSSDAFMTL